MAIACFILVHSSSDWHLGSVEIFIITSNTAVNICVRVFHFHFQVGMDIPRVELLSYVAAVFSPFEKLPDRFPKHLRILHFH